MKGKNTKIYAIGALIALAVGVLSGILTRGSMQLYTDMITKPPLSPPGWLFPVVWTILYILMGVGAAMIWSETPGAARSRGLNLYVAQLVVNFFWSLIFFNGQAYGFAALWLILLWVLVFLMILQFWKINKTAAYLQIPYLLWLSFAAYLNIAVWLINR